MDKKKAIELIKLEVLGCLTDKEREDLKTLKENVDEFTWKELAEYQKLVTLLPSALEMKYPASELKDKTATKLYNIRDEIKAKIEAKKAQEITFQQVEEKSELIENLEVEEKIEAKENSAVEENVEIEIEEKVFADAEEGFHINADEPLTVTQDDSFRFVSNFKEKVESKNLISETHDKTEVPISKITPEKDVIEKIARDYIKSHIEKDIELLNQKLKKNKILSFIFFFITLILIGALYFIK
jgi:hypothetical protein